MLTKIEVDSFAGASMLTLVPGQSDINLNSDVNLYGMLQIRDIQGLDPVKADINTLDKPIKGALFLGSHSDKRNIVLTLGLNPDWEAGTKVASLRDVLSRYFLPGLQCRMRFFTDFLAQVGLIGGVEITGYSEGMTSNIFSKDTEVQISIVCPDPDFVSKTVQNVHQALVNDAAAGISFSAVDTPLVVALALLPSNQIASTGTVTIYSGDGSGRSITVTGVTIDSTYRFEMSSVPGNKYVRKVKISDGTYTDLIRYSTIGTAGWPVISAAGGGVKVHAHPPQQLDMTYYPRYGGL